MADLGRSPKDMHRILPIIILSCLSLVPKLFAADHEPHVWHSEDKSQAVVSFRIDGEPSEEKVRNQTAGMFDGITNPKMLLYPRSAAFVVVSGLPGISLEGTSYAEGGKRSVAIIAVFGADRSFIIQRVSAGPAEIEDWQTKAFVSGEPFKAAEPILREIADKVNRDIGSLQELMRKEIKKAGMGEPDGTANAGAAPQRG